MGHCSKNPLPPVDDTVFENGEISQYRKSREKRRK